MPDVSAAIAPKSQQLDNIELRGKGPQIFTITGVDVRETLDQPLIVHLAEFPRPWKPGKTMGRVLAQCWGLDSDDWIGKRVELFADESIKFGNDTPGGTRISRLSDIDGPKSAAILLGQGKPGLYKVDPLPDPTPADRVTALRNEWKTADPARKKAIEAEVAALSPTSGAEAAPEPVSSVEPTSNSAPEPDVPDPHDGNDPWVKDGVS